MPFPLQLQPDGSHTLLISRSDVRVPLTEEVSASFKHVFLSLGELYHLTLLSWTNMEDKILVHFQSDVNSVLFEFSNRFHDICWHLTTTKKGRIPS